VVRGDDNGLVSFREIYYCSETSCQGRSLEEMANRLEADRMGRDL
jgi:hypothetical protein